MKIIPGIDFLPFGRFNIKVAIQALLDKCSITFFVSD